MKYQDMIGNILATFVDVVDEDKVYGFYHNSEHYYNTDYYAQNKYYFDELEKLAIEKDEQESRKDKLIVGSKWECIIRCNGMSFIHTEGTVVKISNMNGDSEVLTTPLTELENYLDPTGEYVDIDDVLTTQQFLLCFRPLK